ncbi:RNase III inhibitor [Campylobacter ureolyticus]|uniref:RNase III inhibitor n=2 Tax=Campylobacter ureolyticus TaxID=827 RepID=A0A6N2SSG1_9BACT
MISYEISIKRGDLLDEKADILVNPSNTLMLLGSGVSRAFFCRCGGGELECLM